MMNEQRGKLADRQMDGWTDGRMDGLGKGQIDGEKYRLKDRHTD